MNKKRTLIIALIITFTGAGIELAGGLISHSLALISDASHMFSDSAALMIGLIAMSLARRTQTEQMSFGFGRFEVLGAFTNGMLLVCMVCILGYEFLERVQNPPDVDGWKTLIPGTWGLIVNLLVLFVLNHPHSHDNSEGHRAIIGHIIADLIGSICVLLSAGIIIITGQTLFDPYISLITLSLILWIAIRIIISSGHILLEGHPKTMTVRIVKEKLGNDPRVADIHDVHIWKIDSKTSIMSAHIQMKPGSNSEELLHDLLIRAKKYFGTRLHATFQMEYQCLGIARCPS